jgi:hypothetical protein
MGTYGGRKKAAAPACGDFAISRDELGGFVASVRFRSRSGMIDPTDVDLPGEGEKP